MIPKKIHYVWVGGKEKPKNIRRCMESWQRNLSDYEIIEWNEHNFDLNQNEYIKQAYAAKKWAYVSDYIRASVVNQYGGIYLDTDVLVLDNLEQFLDNAAFVGFENPQYPFTAVFGAKANHPLTNDMVHFFDNLDFSFDKQDQMKSVNTKTVSDILIEKYHCQVNNQEQVLPTGIHVYPDNILCNPSINSSTIHVFNGSWIEGEKSRRRKIAEWLKLRITSKRKAEIYRRLIG